MFIAERPTRCSMKREGWGSIQRWCFFLGGRGEEGKRKGVPRDSFDVFSFGAPRPMYLITLVILFPAGRHQGDLGLQYPGLTSLIVGRCVIGCSTLWDFGI